MLQRKTTTAHVEPGARSFDAPTVGKQTRAESGAQPSSGPSAGSAGSAGSSGPARMDDWPATALTDAMGLGGGGSPLPAAQASQFGASLGADLSAVRVHTGESSARAADELGARAFTVGNDIHFGASEFRPNDAGGAHLLAHEVAHTVQQGGQRGAQAKLEVGSPTDALEGEADRAADAMVSGAPAQVSSAPGVATIRRSVRSAADGARAEARKQHEARGANPEPAPGSGSSQPFNDMGKDDRGPEIHHDHGHMEGADGNFDPSKHQDPTMADRWELMKWIAKLEAAELLRPDLVDGTSAYRHFLQGNGATRDIRYPRYIANDAAGARLLQSAMDDARDAAIRRHDADVGGDPKPGTHSYHIRTDTIPVGGGDDRYPYPATENWQKAIGAHIIWIEANVTVTVRAPEGTPPNSCPVDGYERVFHIEMTIHAEDMYNFNPGAADIATNTPDSANGRFEITGLGHEYLNRGTYARAFDFTTTMDPAPAPGSGGPAVTPGRAPRTGSAPGSRNRGTER